MKKLNFYLKKPKAIGIFHDSRQDIRTLAKCINILKDKVNELVEENNNLNKLLKDNKN